MKADITHEENEKEQHVAQTSRQKEMVEVIEIRVPLMSHREFIGAMITLLIQSICIIVSIFGSIYTTYIIGIIMIWTSRRLLLESFLCILLLFYTKKNIKG